MAQINVSNLTFCYEGSYDNIFENVSFRIDTGWRLGFIGRNGKGKTTFLKLLMGKLEYEGSIKSPTVFEYFPFDTGDISRNTLDVIEGIHPDYELWMLCRELDLLDVDAEVLYRPFETLSNGERTKVLLALLFSRENEFLLIDEPTNHLDGEAREKIMEYLKKKKGFLLVSHDRHFLNGCVDHILALNKTNIEIQQGNFDTWQQNKKLQDEFEMAENRKLQKDIARLTEAAARTAGWSDKIEKTKFGGDGLGPKPDRGFIGHKSAKMMKRAKAVEGRISRAAEEKKKLLKNIEEEEEIKLFPLVYHKEVLIEAKDLSLSYDGKTVCSHVNFALRRGERIALAGKNGCGKSTLLKKIMGEDIETGGELRVGSGLIISYVPQDVSGLKGRLEDFAEQNGIDGTLFRALLRKLDFSRVQFEKRMEDYSQGQKKKVMLARSLCQQAHLYIWDEPLNYIDIFSRIQLENLILKYHPAMIFVEHDKAFVEKTASDVIYLQN